MTRSLRMRFCLPVAAALCAALALAPAAAADIVPGEVIVRYEAGTGTGERADVREDAGTASIQQLGLSRAQLLRITDGESVAATVRELEADPDVAYAEPNAILRPALLPDDPEFDQQWGLFNDGQTVPPVGGTAGFAGADIDAPSAWNIETGDPATIVAVMDTGADLAHPDLVNQVWSNTLEAGGTAGVDDDGNGYIDDVNGWDFCGQPCPGSAGDPDPSDLTGHGTHVAGIALAEGDNALNTAGVAWDASLMPLRICSTSYVNSCPLSAEIEAMQYAVDMGADVVNGSIEGGTPSDAVQDIAAAHPETLFVFAAGNGGVDGVGDNNDVSPRYPCALDQDAGYTANNVICVAATTHFDTRASFSNYGPSSVDLGAPGASILSTSAETEFLDDDFEVDDFATEWTNSVGNTQDWSRTSESPLTSFGITDSAGSDYSPNASSEVTSAPVTIPADQYSSCELHYDRGVDLGAGDIFSIEVLLDGSLEEWRNFSSSSNSGMVSRFFALNPSFDDGGQVQVRLRLTSNPTGGGDGAHMDNIRLFCYGSPSDDITEYLSGTSMAAPMVSGAAALLFSNLPGESASQIKTRLLSSVDQIPALAGITTSGGRLNVHRALTGDFNAPSSGGGGGSAPNPVSSGTTSSRKPNTFFNRKPGKVVRTERPMARVVFRFGSTEANSSFRCKLDGAAFVPCGRKLVRRLPPARHVLKVKAVAVDGAVDPTAAVAKFRIKQIDG